MDSDDLYHIVSLHRNDKNRNTCLSRLICLVPVSSEDVVRLIKLYDTDNGIIDAFSLLVPSVKDINRENLTVIENCLKLGMYKTIINNSYENKFEVPLPQIVKRNEIHVLSFLIALHSLDDDVKLSLLEKHLSIIDPNGGVLIMKHFQPRNIGKVLWMTRTELSEKRHIDTVNVCGNNYLKSTFTDDVRYKLFDGMGKTVTVTKKGEMFIVDTPNNDFKRGYMNGSIIVEMSENSSITDMTYGPNLLIKF